MQDLKSIPDVAPGTCAPSLYCSLLRSGAVVVPSATCSREGHMFGRRGKIRRRHQTRLAAKLIIRATTATLKKNATIACNVTSRRNSFELILTSEVCEAAPIEVEK